MANNLLGLVQQIAGDALVNNAAIPETKTKTAIESITDGIFSGLKTEATGGGLGQIIGMFSSGGKVSNSLVNNVQTSVISSLMDKVGITNSVAKTIAAQVVPAILSALSKGASDPKNKDFDAAGMLSSLTGSKGSGIDFKSLLDKGIGNGDGKLDLNDVIGLLGEKSNGSTSNASSQSGGLLDALGGLLGGK